MCFNGNGVDRWTDVWVYLYSKDHVELLYNYPSQFLICLTRCDVLGLLVEYKCMVYLIQSSDIRQLRSVSA